MNRNVREQRLRTVIREHYKLEKPIERLITLATYDLLFGPIGPTDDDGEPWPGFEKACEEITTALNVGELWISEWDEVRDTEPDWSEIEDEPDDDGCFPSLYYGEDWTYLKRAGVLRLLVGKELAEYI